MQVQNWVLQGLAVAYTSIAGWSKLVAHDMACLLLSFAVTGRASKG